MTTVIPATASTLNTRQARYIEGLRLATKPGTWQHQLPSWAPSAAKAGCVAMTAVVGIATFLHQPSLFLAGLASYCLGAWFSTRIRHLSGSGQTYRWAVPVATGLGAVVSPVIGAGALLLPVVAMLGSVLWMAAPWFKPLLEESGRSAGWNTYKPWHQWFGEPMETSDTNLMRVHNRAAQETYLSILQQELTVLEPAWEMTFQRYNTDAIAVGPGGVALLFNVDLEGIEVVGQTPDHPDNVDEVITDAFTVIRELNSRPVVGSKAYEVGQSLSGVASNGRLAHEDAIETMQLEQLALADDLHDELLTVDGHALGPSLPSQPAISAVVVAERIGLPADQAPTLVYIAHGLKMGCKWGRVRIPTSYGFGAATAIVCHPRYIAECLNSLPCVFSSQSAVRGAQHVTDIFLR